MTHKVTASIQARMGSSRLPGKVLRKLHGKEMLRWQVDRIRESRLVDEVVVATTTSPVDDEIVEFCRTYDVRCFRGPEHDVLGRICRLINEFDVELHVECFGDSPFVDPQLIDEFVGFFFKHSKRLDFVTNSLETTYPPGLDFHVYRGSSLLQVEVLMSKDDELREHAGYNLSRFPAVVRTESLRAPGWLEAPGFFLEVDTEEDFEVAKEVLGHFLERGQQMFGAGQLIEFMSQNPVLVAKNSFVQRRWEPLRHA